MIEIITKKIYCILFLYIYINLYASVLLIRKKKTIEEKIYFFLTILWLFPFIGYIYVIYKIDKKQQYKRKHKVTNNSILFEMDETGNRFFGYLIVILYLVVIFYNC